MKARNPFITVGYESPEYFCDRVEETAGPVERPYAFRERLVTVHRNDRGDLSVTARAADALP